MGDLNLQAPEFNYRVLWKSRHPRPGHHRSALPGAGHDYRTRAPLLESPDPRRLALRASLADPYGRLFVHLFNQFSVIPVVALVDTSASMDFVGATDKSRLVFAFLESLAFSAYRTGDPFGLAAGDEQLRLFLPPTRSAGLVAHQIEALAALTPGTGAAGLRKAAAQLGHRRALVFLVSDFNWPAALITGLLGDLARHEVVPIVVRDSAEDLANAPNGLARVTDPETGAERSLWIRPRLKRKAAAAAAAHRAHLTRALRHGQREPFFLQDAVDRDRLNRYFAH